MILLKKVNLIKFVKKSVEEVSTDFDILPDVVIIELTSKVLEKTEVFYSNLAIRQILGSFLKNFPTILRLRENFHFTLLM